MDVSRVSVPVVISPALPRDAEAVRAIYNHAVAHTTATMDLQPRTREVQADWMEQHDGMPYPALVAREPEGSVVGYASLSCYSRKPGYCTTAEVSVYVHCDWHGLKIGTALLSALINEASRRGFVVLIASISADNTASLRLHARHGFVEAGLLRQAGRKFDCWVDVTLMQRILEENISAGA